MIEDLSKVQQRKFVQPSLTFVFNVSLFFFVSQDCIVAAQCALARIYDDPYPCSSNVQRGLAEILNQRFGGSQPDFSDMFVAPTIQLLKRLRTKVNVYQGQYATDYAYFFKPPQHFIRL